MIFIGFKPLNIKQREFIDVPLFQLEAFTLHELNEEGLATIMRGSKATRYSDRYKVYDIDYTDNSKKFIANMRADDGIYRDLDDILDLKGNVLYNREDGLIFESDEATYNKKSAIATTNKDYIMYRGKNRVVGTSLVYNNRLNKVKSKNVVAKYQIQER
ncbi:MAG: LPS export ABC transporter periplasmic protein LptC [Sulfurimonas sp.]|nr:LPS export ABC transporter periplasmic protein LptC [Sulfurimonas sp.]